MNIYISYLTSIAGCGSVDKRSRVNQLDTIDSGLVGTEELVYGTMTENPITTMVTLTERSAIYFLV